MDETEDYNIEIVPWFSSDEWKEVYGNIYGNKADGWKFAHNKLLVWKARVSKLPVGIESTIPLLLAQIALSELSLNDSYKSTIVNMGILRFVSIVTKGFEGSYAAGHTMHNLATRMNLPQYLVDLRNQIIHSDNVSATSLTLKAALNISLQWIKLNYWDEEFKKIKCCEDSLINTVKEDHCSQSVEQDKLYSSSLETFDVPLKFIKNITTLNRVFAKFSDENYSNPHMTQIVKNACVSFNKYYANDPAQCIQILVNELFYSKKMIGLFGTQVALRTKKKCKMCRSVIPAQLMRNLSPLISTVITNRAMDIFFESLFNNIKDCPILCCQWVTAIVNSFFVLKNQHCKYHLFKFKKMKEKQNIIKWKCLMYHLFSISQEWSSLLALLLASALNIDSSKCSQLKELYSLYSNSFLEVKTSDIKDESANDQIEENLRVKVGPVVKDLENLLGEAYKVSGGIHSYVEDLCLNVAYPSTKGNRKAGVECTPLGLLPHQKGDTKFYQKLRLSIPN